MIARIGDGVAFGENRAGGDCGYRDRDRLSLRMNGFDRGNLRELNSQGIDVWAGCFYDQVALHS